jgi:alpha-1,2-mannosyltransferase
MADRDGTRRRWIVAGLVVATVVIVWLAETRNHFFDSRVYYGAMRDWFVEHGMVYDWLRPTTPYGFTYPPFAGLVMAPMAFLPLWAVILIASVATVLSTALVVWWLTAPLIRRSGRPVWFALAVATCLAVAFEPVRETLTFGQVNTLLLALVAGDVLHGVARGRRWAGVGIGLATAIKLTPGIFILYLVVTGRWRAAATAVGTAGAVTVLAGAVAPDESREFWTSALWNTDRVGALYYVSNQSLRGMLARLPLDDYASVLWPAMVLATLGYGAWRARAAVRAGDEVAGLAVTGIVGALISPVSWVHHLVWVLPAVVRCVDAGLSAPPGTRARRLWYLGATAYVLMTSRLLWLWEHGPRPPLHIIGGNLHVWVSLALLVLMPVCPGGQPTGTPHLSLRRRKPPAAETAAPDTPAGEAATATR